MRAISPLVLCAVLSAPLQAIAQPATPPPQGSNHQEFTFTDQLVQSQLPRPDDHAIRGLRARRSGSLLRIRAHFVPEMLRSVERL